MCLFMLRLVALFVCVWVFDRFVVVVCVFGLVAPWWFGCNSDGLVVCSIGL